MSEWTGPRVVLSSPHETLSIQEAGCPFCAGRRVCAGNSLANFPQIVENWHPILNKKRPEEISSSSNEVVWIQCHNHPDHVYSKSANVLARSCKALEKSHNQKPFCLICRGREVVPTSSLAATDPELAKEWDMEKNTLLPTQVTRKSNKKVWWKCPKGHEYEAVIANKTNQKSGCPYCGKKYITYPKSLANLYPEIAAEWHPTKNGTLTPETVFAHSSRKIWWKCSQGHEWCTTVNNRTNYNGNGSKCPVCFKLHRSEKNSSPPKKIPSPAPAAPSLPESTPQETSLTPPSLPISVKDLLDSSLSSSSPNQKTDATKSASDKKQKKKESNAEKRLKREKKKKMKLYDDYIRDSIHPIEGSEHVIHF